MRTDANCTLFGGTGVAFEGIKGRLFPMIGIHESNAQVRVGFGQEAFTTGIAP